MALVGEGTESSDGVLVKIWSDRIFPAVTLKRCLFLKVQCSVSTVE